MYGRTPVPKGQREKVSKMKPMKMANRVCRWKSFMRHICQKAGLSAFTFEIVGSKIESIIFITDNHGAILMFDHPKIVRKAKPSHQEINITPTKRQEVRKIGVAGKAKRKK